MKRVLRVVGMEEWRFRENLMGSPFVVLTPRECHFNISNEVTFGLATVGLANEESSL